MTPDQDAREEALQQQAVASFAAAPDQRLRTLVQTLTRHLHEFVRETRLTEQEWRAAVDFLTDVGHITDDQRQEFILLSDVLGVSMQTITVDNPASGPITEATVFGPFFVDGAPRVELGGDITGGAAGEPCWVEGTVSDPDGRPVAGARLDVWEADESGRYDVQYTDGRTAARAHLLTDATGGFRFWGVTPTPYPIPDDGPVGTLLAATARSPMRAAHLHFMVTAEGHRRLVTHIFPRTDPRLDDDSVFGVRPSLVKDFEQQAAGTPTPDGRDLGDRPWSRVRFDIVLASADG